MVTFRITKSFRIHRVLSCIYPILALAGGFKLVSSGYYTVTDWAPIVMISIIIWFFYQISITIKDFSFSVVLSDKAIRVGENSMLWSDITRANIGKAFGRNAAIILYTNSGERIEIPAIVERLSYLKRAMEKYLTKAKIIRF